MTEEQETKQRVRLIIGYGNPGKRYIRARSNVGYLIIDSAVVKIKNTFPIAITSDWVVRSKYMLLITNPDPLTMVVKPRTFEKKFDDTAFGLYSFYKVAPEDFYVIYPDENLPLGQYKVSRSSGSIPEAISKIQKKIKSQDWWRVRIGIGGANKELNEIEYARIRNSSYYFREARVALTLASRSVFPALPAPTWTVAEITSSHTPSTMLSISP